MICAILTYINHMFPGLDMDCTMLRIGAMNRKKI